MAKILVASSAVAALLVASLSSAIWLSIAFDRAQAGAWLSPSILIAVVIALLPWCIAGLVLRSISRRRSLLQWLPAITTLASFSMLTILLASIIPVI